MSRSYHGARGGRFGSGGRPKSGSSSPSGRRAAKFVRRPLSRAASSWLAAASSDVAYQPSTWPLPPPLAGSVARNLRAAGALSTPAYAVGSSSRFAFSSSAPDSEAAPLFLRRFGARAASPLRDGAFFVGDDARPLLGAGGDAARAAAAARRRRRRRRRARGLGRGHGEREPQRLLERAVVLGIRRDEVLRAAPPAVRLGGLGHVR